MPDLYPHQQDALLKLQNGSILCGGVGSGKSRTAIAYYLNCENPPDLYVITTAKKRDSLDWEKEAAGFAIGKTKDSTVAGVLTVDSWNNMEKYKDVENAFFIFDEQRLVGSGLWTKTFIKIAKKNSWILLSATPGDTWLDYIPVFVANGYYKNRTQFLRDHVIYNHYSKFPKVDRYIGVGKLVRLRNKILVDMPYERHTRRHEHIVEVDFDEALFERVVKDRWHVYENRPLRDVAELFSVMRKVANSDASRLEAVRGLMETQPKLIVFYNFNYELDILRSLSTTLINEEQSPKTETSSTTQSKTDTETEECLRDATLKDATDNYPTAGLMNEEKNFRISHMMGGAESLKEDGPNQNDLKGGINKQTPPLAGLTKDFEIAEWNGHKHQPIPKTDRWLYLVQYTAGSEGWNCIETDAICFFSLNYSYKIWEQSHGRIDRLNTPFVDLHYYILKSNSWIDKAIMKALKGKKSFNERKAVEKVFHDKSAKISLANEKSDFEGRFEGLPEVPLKTAF